MHTIIRERDLPLETFWEWSAMCDIPVCPDTEGKPRAYLGEGPTEEEAVSSLLALIEKNGIPQAAREIHVWRIQRVDGRINPFRAYGH